jgi:hypothetical protein
MVKTDESFKSLNLRLAVAGLKMASIDLRKVWEMGEMVGGNGVRNHFSHERGTGIRRCEKILDEQKHFTQRRKVTEGAKKTKQLPFAVFASWRLCVRLFILSHLLLPV